MAPDPLPTTNVDATTEPQLSRAMVEHAYLAVRVQMLLRAVLIVFVLLAVALLPPAHGDAACYAIVIGYAGWLLLLARWVFRGAADSLDHLWPAMFVDVAAIAGLTLLSGISAQESWTSDVLVRGFFIIPVIAAAQQRWRVCMAVCAPAIAVYLAVNIVTRNANAEPWASILARTVVLTGLAAGCTLLSRVQASRVRTISTLVSDRDSLLGQLVTIESHERSHLAENLHDGALQYVLAARLDLEDLRGPGREADAEPLNRIDQALRESATLLRSTVSQLHPAVLDQSGLRRALTELARTTAAGGRVQVEIDAEGWPEHWRTSADALLFTTARELLTNVVKHAAARRVTLSLAFVDGIARLIVADDGRGFQEDTLGQRLADGHIGVASHRVRLEAVGGGLALRNRQPSGTIAEVWLPATVRNPAEATTAVV